MKKDSIPLEIWDEFGFPMIMEVYEEDSPAYDEEPLQDPLFSIRQDGMGELPRQDDRGGWDSQPTSIMEVYETEDTAGDEDGVCRDTAGAVLRHDLPDLADPQGSGAGGG